MAEEGKKSLLGALVFGLGMLVGGFFVYVVLKKEEITSPIPSPSPSFTGITDTSPIDNETMNASDNEEKIKILTPENQVLNLNDRVAPVGGTVGIVTDKVQLMKNNEEWTIRRNKEGRIETISVNRNAYKEKK